MRGAREAAAVWLGVEVILKIKEFGSWLRVLGSRFLASGLRTLRNIVAVNSPLEGRVKESRALRTAYQYLRQEAVTDPSRWPPARATHG